MELLGFVLAVIFICLGVILVFIAAIVKFNQWRCKHEIIINEEEQQKIFMSHGVLSAPKKGMLCMNCGKRFKKNRDETHRQKEQEPKVKL